MMMMIMIMMVVVVSYKIVKKPVLSIYAYQVNPVKNILGPPPKWYCVLLTGRNI